MLRPCTVTSLCLAALLMLTACGSHTHDVQKYVRDVKNPASGFSKKVDGFLIYALINGTYQRNGALLDSLTSLFFDSASSESPPYTLVIGMAFYENRIDPAIIEEVTIRIGDQQEVVLLDEHAELFSEEWLDHADSTQLKFLLGDLLRFEDGQSVLVEVQFRTPGSERSETLTTIFKGVKELRSTSKLMMILQGG